jgi:Ca2+-binding EF-hand superfamily protein
MPNEHIYFMAFLFYDSNNDGYICANDLIRMEEVSLKSKLIAEDYEIIKSNASKIKFKSKTPYKELYRLPEITETTFFNWLKK